MDKMRFNIEAVENSKEDLKKEFDNIIMKFWDIRAKLRNINSLNSEFKDKYITEFDKLLDTMISGLSDKQKDTDQYISNAIANYKSTERNT